MQVKVRATMATVERYRARTRATHWIHSAAFLALIVTGAIIFVPAWGPIAAGGMTRFIHRIAAVLFVGIPLIYMVINWSASWKGIKEAFTWTKDDLGWALAAPAYYFTGNEEAMPPQEHMNTGQKLYWLLVIVTGVLFTITGAIMWFTKDIAQGPLFRWSIFAHDVAFIVIFGMFLVHIYLSLVHPVMHGVWKSMLTGEVPAEYAKSHHGKWYERYIKEKRAS